MVNSLQGVAHRMHAHMPLLLTFKVLLLTNAHVYVWYLSGRQKKPSPQPLRDYGRAGLRREGQVHPTIQDPYYAAWLPAA